MKKTAKKFSYMKKKEIRRRLQKAADHLQSLIDEKRACKIFGGNDPVYEALDKVTRLQDMFGEAQMPKEFGAEGPSKNKGTAPKKDKGAPNKEPVKKTHRISPAGLKRIRDAQKRRWAAVKAKAKPATKAA
jgi:hypothetical protein